MQIIKGKKIGADNYMRRWGVKGKWVTIYLHIYDGSDPREEPHNHPWTWWGAWVVRGRLTEDRFTCTGPRYRVVRSPLSGVSILPGSVFHRIAAVTPGTITLFVGWRRWRAWGFLPREPNR